MTLDARPNLERDYLAGYTLPTELEIIEAAIKSLTESTFISHVSTDRDFERPIRVPGINGGTILPVETPEEGTHLGTVTVIKATLKNPARSIEEEALQTRASVRAANLFAGCIDSARQSIIEHLSTHGRTERRATSIADEVIPRTDTHAFRTGGYLYDLEGRSMLVNLTGGLLISERIYELRGEGNKSQETVKRKYPNRERAAVYIFKMGLTGKFD